MNSRVIAGVAVTLGSLWATGGGAGIAICLAWRAKVDPLWAWLTALGGLTAFGVALAVTGAGLLLGRTWGARGVQFAARVALPAVTLVVGGAIFAMAIAWKAPPLFPISAAVVTGLSAVVAWRIGRRVSLLLAVPLTATHPGDASEDVSFRARSSQPWVLGFLLAAVLVAGVVLARRAGKGAAARPAPPDLVKTACIRGRSSTPDTPHVAGQPDATDLEVDQYEITVEQYRACVEAGACKSTSRPERAVWPQLCNEHQPGKGDHPINCVSFSDAQAFCAWTGKRLPTIAEWTFVAYGNDGRKYPWGFAFPDRERETYFHLGHGIGFQEGTHKVGSHPRGESFFHTFDMVGNVAEWTAEQPCPPSGCVGLTQMTRGGSFTNMDELDGRFGRSAADANGDANVGIRCVRTISPRSECLEPPLGPMGHQNPRFEGSGKMVLVPAGDFDMGSADEPDSMPVHRVHVDAFYLDVTEVSRAAFKGCARVGSCEEQWPENDPVHSVGVPVEDADRFCRWAGKRLPTESEWEYAAGGTDRRPFPWGKELPGKQVCWSGPGSGYAPDPRLEPCAIGSSPADKSPFGLIDMGGNQSEWTSSPLCSYESHSCTSKRVTRGGSAGSMRVVDMLVSHRGTDARAGIRCAHTPP